MISSATAPATRPTGSAFDLTGRERDVQRLLSEGLTNPQIAARLGVSVTTVAGHVRSVFSKLGVRTRAAATRVALEQDRG
ncbi:response regulator transcription factor [Deinococcus apachensis]|uniref:response regulator transcription factor n=1 Tax=Deinococcus apachensis TaxID=309886 RepID=UPI00037DB1AF|nr:LuxR C-terminal-related transcriptional regulator [Deinococcus apachensis]